MPNFDSPTAEEDSDDYRGIEDNYYELFAGREKIRGGHVQLDMTNRSPEKARRPPAPPPPQVADEDSPRGQPMSLDQYSRSPPDRWDQLDFDQRFEPLNREIAAGMTQSQRASVPRGPAAAAAPGASEDADEEQQYRLQRDQYQYEQQRRQPQPQPQQQQQQQYQDELRRPSRQSHLEQQQQPPPRRPSQQTEEAQRRPSQNPRDERDYQQDRRPSQAQLREYDQQLEGYQRQQRLSQAQMQQQAPPQQQQPRHNSQVRRNIFDDESDDEDFQHGVHDQSLFDTLISGGSTSGGGGAAARARLVEQAIARARASDPSAVSSTAAAPAPRVRLPPKRPASAIVGRAPRDTESPPSSERPASSAPRDDFDMNAVFDRLSSTNVRAPPVRQQQQLQQSQRQLAVPPPQQYVSTRPAREVRVPSAATTTTTAAAAMDYDRPLQPAYRENRLIAEQGTRIPEETEWQFAAKRAERESRRLAKLLAEAQTEVTGLRREVDDLRNHQIAIQRMELRLKRIQGDYNKASKKVLEQERKEIEMQQVQETLNNRIRIFERDAKKLKKLQASVGKDSKAWDIISSLLEMHLVSGLDMQQRPMSDYAARLLPVLSQVLLQVADHTPKFRRLLISFVWQCILSDTESDKTLLTSTYKHIFDAVVHPQKAMDPMVNSDDPVVRMVAQLIVLLLRSDTARMSEVLDTLRHDLTDEDTRKRFVDLRGLDVITPLLRSTVVLVVSPVANLFLALCTEGPSLPRFLAEISSEHWFRACGVAMAREQVEVQEMLSVVLQKLSRITNNRRLFETADLVGTLRQLEHSTQREFLKMNIRSILKNLRVKGYEDSLVHTSMLASGAPM
eukprot:TRINITY_DN10697_c0_g1_i1.p1 TRINITY_DN10697_c0_g1~~TRINITY_DN10697_c0_g1_i1.p1  ORF type:complete len:845 (-),score=239.36 TRINITY_DN10697_c0_g1_i1:145-2679(-)